MNIHPTAIVDPAACLGKDSVIGPYCTVGPGVTLHQGVHLISHVVVEGNTLIGDHTVVHPFASLGTAPQHLAYEGEPSRLIIGAHNQIREHVTIHRGTAKGGGLTVIGSFCLIMVGCHIAHDCHIGSHVIMANQGTLGGHVLLEDYVVLGGMVALHQFTRIGEGAMVGGFSAIGQDVVPYGIALGNRGTLEGLNVKKLKMLNSSKEEMAALAKTHQWLFHNTTETFLYRVQHIPTAFLLFPRVRKVQDFILANGKRSICMPRSWGDFFQASLQEATSVP